MEKSLAEHVDIIWTGFLGAVAALMGLLGILYRRINSDINGLSVQLASGVAKFAEIDSKLAGIAERLGNIDRDDTSSDSKIVECREAVDEVRLALARLQTEHIMYHNKEKQGVEK